MTGFYLKFNTGLKWVKVGQYEYSSEKISNDCFFFSSKISPSLLENVGCLTLTTRLVS